jgi:hypothetical protein
MKVLLACPSRRGVLHHETVKSLLGIQNLIHANRGEVEVTMVASAEISTARNILATIFLHSSCNLLLCIDDDVGVSQDVAEKILASGNNYVGSYIPQRTLDLSVFAKNVRSGLSDNEAQMEAAPLVGTATDKTGIFEVDQVGCGFFALRKPVLQVMVDKEIAVRQKTNLAAFQGTTYGFYNNIIEDDGGETSEDYSFCRRVREAGFSVFAYRGQGITHTGEMTFHS